MGFKKELANRLLDTSNQYLEVASKYNTGGDLDRADIYYQVAEELSNTVKEILAGKYDG